jgi:hypothetical protein
MTTIENKVNEILGIKSDDKPALESIIKTDNSTLPKIKDNNKSDVDNDYDYSRENYYNLIEKGQEAIEGILEIAKEGQAPRSYEVLGALISNVATTIEKLQDLQKKMKDLKDLPKTASPQIKNALFVGSTKDLQQLLRQKDQKEDKVE